MPLPLPNLDTRRWQDLVDDGIAQLPRYAPAWTDFNAHDPGITLLELFAWIAEMDVYRTNRVPVRHLLKFLGLIGFPPHPPIAARVPLTFTGSGTVPAGSQFSTASGIGFRTLRALTSTSAAIAALQVDAGIGALLDQTSKLGTGSQIELFGLQPVAGSAAYIGFSQLPASVQHLYVWLAQSGGGTSTFVWEAYTGGSQPWTAVTAEHDGTLAFLHDGPVELTVPAGLVEVALGEVATPLYYLRCRLLTANYDSTPLLTGIAVNTTIAEQSIPATVALTINSSASITGTAPASGDAICFDCSVDSSGNVASIAFLPANTAGHPPAQVGSYLAPTAAKAGSLTIDLVLIDATTLRLPNAPIAQHSLEVFTQQAGTWQEWTRRNDLDSSKRSDFHFAVDPTLGVLTFGDGEYGRALPSGALIFARYRTTLADQGNAGVGLITTSSLSGLAVTNLSAVEGGAAQEDIEGATSRAAAILYCHDRRSPHAPTNGVNLEDYERMALSVPHTKVARAKAYANLDARYPCLTAPGSITVVIIPDMQVPQPTPTAHLLQAVFAYLDRRRTVCTQVHVTGPSYVAVSVTATIAVLPGSNAANVQQAIVTALASFLNPLTGGPAGTGWPFGRGVYRSDIMQIIAGIAGVDYISSLTISATGGGTVTCGNLAICAGSLVSSGTHQISTVTEAAQ